MQRPFLSFLLTGPVEYMDVTGISKRSMVRVEPFWISGIGGLKMQRREGYRECISRFELWARRRWKGLNVTRFWNQWISNQALSQGYSSEQCILPPDFQSEIKSTNSTLALFSCNVIGDRWFNFLDSWGFRKISYFGPLRTSWNGGCVLIVKIWPRKSKSTEKVHNKNKHMRIFLCRVPTGYVNNWLMH